MTSQPTTTRIYVYVDADACPVKDEIYRVAARHGLPVSVVAGNFIRVPQDPLIERIAAGSAMDAADDRIAERAGAFDIVITADIPLAADVIAKGGRVLDPRGELHTPDTIRERLAMRDFMEALRSSGVQTGGPEALSQADRKRFAGQLDRLLANVDAKDG